jgi:TonB family protein
MIELPDFLGDDSGIIPIQLLGSRELHLDVLPENRAHRFREAGQKRGKPDSRVAPVDATVLEKKMQELSLGESLRMPSPDVLVPPIQKNVSQQERTRRIWASPFYKEIAKAFEQARKSGGTYEGMRFSIDASPDILKKEKIEIDPGTEQVLMRLQSAREDKSRGKGEEGKLGIAGPICRRQLTYVPPIPDVKASIETEFRIKFWVRPNGTVDRVIPVKRAGDIELERLATNYLRKLRFRAIPENEPQIEQWGTVTIKFRLQ